jgi:5-formyltetrahydrofolate cyclo-ligase
MEASGKSELRSRIRGMVRGVSTDERKRLSQALCEVMRTQMVWQTAERVLFYSPLADEADLTLLLDEALPKKSVALPRFDSTTGCYCAAQIMERSQLTAGKFGALEPGAGCPSIPLNQLDLVFVPGVAYDFTGRRLGRGKGFYDRLLAEVRGHKCGVAFDAQIVAAVPEEPHDIRVDSILTPTRWHLCPRAA